VFVPKIDGTRNSGNDFRQFSRVPKLYGRIQISPQVILEPGKFPINKKNLLSRGDNALCTKFFQLARSGISEA
jgi:hypothetical protein